MDQELQNDYKIVDGRSEVTHAILTEDSRYRKAEKIRSVLTAGDTSISNFRNLKVLDIGTGSGHIAKYFANLGALVSSVDTHDLRQIKEGYDFMLTSDEHLPFADEHFDLVITNHVIEHVNNQALHLSEISRVLKKGAICYLATPSKFTPLEPHYRLPFLSWFPEKLAASYLKLAKNKVWDIKPLTVSMVNAISGNRFDIIEASPKIMHKPKEYGLDMAPKLHPIFALIPLFVWKAIAPILPAMVLVMAKKNS